MRRPVAGHDNTVFIRHFPMNAETGLGVDSGRVLGNIRPP